MGDMTAMTAEQVRAELGRIARWIKGEIRFSRGKSPATDHDRELHQAAKALDQLAARLSGMAAGWRPIETAPKDGIPVSLQRRDGSLTNGIWCQKVCRWNCYGTFFHDDQFIRWFRIPTPTPPPPAAPEVPGHG